MNPLHRLWFALEEVHGHCATLIEWRRRLGEDFDLARRFLHPINQRAASAPIANDPNELPYRIGPVIDGKVEAISDAGDIVVTLDQSEVLIYRVAFRPLAQAIAMAFGIDVSFESVPGIPRAHRIGNYRPFSGTSFAAFFVCAMDSGELTRVIESLLARWSGPFVVIVPTARRNRTACEDLIRARNICRLTLAEMVAMDQTGQLTSLPTANDALTSFLRAMIPQSAEESLGAFFPTPPDARWQDVKIKLIDCETISVRIGQVTRVLTYHDMNMFHKRNRRRTKQWDLLVAFAEEHGYFTWNSPGAHRKNQSRREILAENLRSFFRIDGDPIEYVEKPKKGWRTLFSIEPA